MGKYKIHDEDKLKVYLSKYKSSPEISKATGLDNRIVHRAMRNYGLIDEQEPDAAIRMRIKDTEFGRKLAKALGLKVGVIYPDEYQRSDIGSEVPK